MKQCSNVKSHIHTYLYWREIIISPFWFRISIIDIMIELKVCAKVVLYAISEERDGSAQLNDYQRE